MSIPTDAIMDGRPRQLSNWEVQREYDTSACVENVDTGDHVQLRTAQDKIRLVPMVSSQGMGFSSVQSEGVTVDADDTEQVVEVVWQLAEKIRSGTITSNDADFSI